jgi:hypothetical protein
MDRIGNARNNFRLCRVPNSTLSITQSGLDDKRITKMILLPNECLETHTKNSDMEPPAMDKRDKAEEGEGFGISVS